MRTWKPPEWLADQRDAAISRGWATIKNYGHGREWAVINWHNTSRVDDEFGRKCLVELNVTNSKGEKEKYVFDAEELKYWLQWA